MSRNGPIFGSGADLCISSECNRNKDSYSKLPYTYGGADTPNNLLTGESMHNYYATLSDAISAGEQYFLVEDYEVFGISR